MRRFRTGEIVEQLSHLRIGAAGQGAVDDFVVLLTTAGIGGHGI